MHDHNSGISCMGTTERSAVAVDNQAIGGDNSATTVTMLLFY